MQSVLELQQAGTANACSPPIFASGISLLLGLDLWNKQSNSTLGTEHFQAEEPFLNQWGNHIDRVRISGLFTNCTEREHLREIRNLILPLSHGPIQVVQHNGYTYIGQVEF